MHASYFSLFDMAICGIPALAFGVWQLVSVNREIAKDRQARAVQPKGSSPEGPGHPIGEHRLNDR